jgi:hypothetical protein
MPIRDPAEFGRVYFESFNSGRLDALMALYEPGIATLPQPGPVTGTDAVRPVLSGFLATKGAWTATSRRLSDLVNSHWSAPTGA